MEFMPITTSGNAHFRYPLVSITQLKPATNRKQIPPLNRVQLGVQMRLTIGHKPEKCSNAPAATPIAPASSSRRYGIRGAESRSHRPQTKPRIIVPSVGMKLNV